MKDKWMIFGIMHKWMIFGIMQISLIYFLFIYPVLATSDLCIDNMTLQRTYNYTFRHGTAQNNLTITRTEICRNGCDNVTNICRNPEIIEYSTYFGALVVILIIAGVLIKLFR